MVNAWSLLYSEMNGTMDEDYPIMSKKDKDVVTFPVKNDDVTIVGGAGTDTIEIKGNYDWGDDGHSVVGNPFVGSASSDTITFTSDGVGAADTIALGGGILGGMGEDHISFSGAADPDLFASMDGVDPVYAYHYPGTEKETAEWERIEKPKPDLKSGSTQKYQEDKGIKDLKDYVASTYQGHYTNDNSDVQTLDLIHSVGDAESFCRSNAIKYLSRYDKKGSAKRDILKAMHYCLLLYYFSGQTNETPTRGYETF